MERVQLTPAMKLPGRRKSVFMEVGLVDEDTVRRERSPAPILVSDPSSRPLRPARTVRFRSRHDYFDEREELVEDGEDGWESTSEDEADIEIPEPSQVRQNLLYSKLHRLSLLAFVLAVLLPIFQLSTISSVGVKGGVIPRETIESTKSPVLVERADAPTEVCKRWAGQSTVVNGTLYMYGFRTTTDAHQTSNTWTNDFLSLDLTKSWQIANPSLTGLPQPSGPPAVSLGYLWSSHTSLYLYGGQYSDNPQESPGPNSVWEYNIGNKQWIEHKDPQSSSGDNAEGGGQSIQRAAEGAGFSVSNLGRGWYFGGHQDVYTTPDWPHGGEWVRVYLKSMLEFTFPGFGNEAVDDLKGGKTAGDDGVYRNITEGGIQDTGSFPERADGVLVYVPGFGDEGTLIGFSGGDNDTFAQMNVIDVYDIAKSQWYKQSTSGQLPKYRVNTCAVVAAAPDGSSYNIYMYGGQTLQPAGNQTQYDDMWILSVPSFTWIEVDQKGQSMYARAGHSCHVWDGQMIVIGGYVGEDLSCESPGIYTFNLTSLTWNDQFTALTGDHALEAWDGKENSPANPYAQQANQRGSGVKAGLEGSYGYEVPEAVQSVIGGQATGGATLTAPVQTPTEGPFKSGTPQTYTVTGPNGATITQVTGGGSASSGGSHGPNVGAIVAGVIAGVFFVVAAYFAFCTWIYRKQVKIWKNHAAMVAARGMQEKNDPFAAQGASFIASSGKNSTERAQRDMLATRSSEATSGIRTSDERAGGLGGIGYAGAAGVAGASVLAGPSGEGGRRRSSSSSSTDDLLAGQEPSFWGAKGVLLNPRRSLRVINRD